MVTNKVNRRLRVSSVEHFFRAVGLLDRDLQFRIEAAKVGFVLSLRGCDQRLQLFLLRRIQHDDRRRLARNRILRAPTLDVGDFNRQTLERLLEHAAQNAQRVAAALMNIHAGVPTLQTKHLDAPTGAARSRDAA